MRVIRDLRKKTRTVRTELQDVLDLIQELQDLLNTFRELRDTIRSIDRERIPDPKKAIQALKRSVRVARKAGLDQLKKLRAAIQDLQDAIDSLKTKAKTRMPDLSMAEWWWNLKNVLDNLKKVGPSINKVRVPRTDNLSLDRIAEEIAGFGVPGLVLATLMAVSPWFGAAAIASSLAALAALGPFGGMVGGIAALGVLAFISRALAKFGFEKVCLAVLGKLRKDGKTFEEIREEINKYPISKELKRKLEEFLEDSCEGENYEQ